MRLLSRLIWILLSVGLFRLLDDVIGLDLYLIYVLPAVLILLFGLPHGATDHILSNFIKSRRISGRVSLSFIVMYLMIIFFYALIWYFSPEIALLIFLLLSAYHFGETQWIEAESVNTNELLMRIHNFSWGVFLLGFLFTLHDHETLSFLTGLVSESIASQSLIVMINWVLPISAISTVILSVLLYDWKTSGSQLVQLVALIILFWTTELIYAFAIFFTLFHSRDTILAMISIISKEAQVQYGWMDFYKKAIPFTLLSLFGILFVITLINQVNVEIHLITLFFVMISLITAPHMWIIEQFYRASK